MIEKLIIALFFFGLCLYFFGFSFEYLEQGIAILALIRGIMALA